MEQVRNEQTIYSAAVYCRLSKGETSRQAYKRTVVLLKNTYLYGNLIKIQRRGNPLNSQNSNNLTAVQDYNFSYDIFQNRTQTAVGSRVLSTNTYDAYRTLQRSTYGNGVFVAYSYDALERLTGKENSDGEWRERYAYGTDGELIEKVITDKTSGAVEKTVHYEYDSLGRLICTEERGADGSILSRSEQGYTVKGQASAQSYFDGQQTRQSSYTYDDAGMLTGMQTGGGEQISYTYDYLNRLTRKTVGTTPYTYTYYAPYENLESALPHSILYQSTAGPVEEFQYTYDNLGNIKTTWERTGNSPLAKTGEYWYDRFNQLTREETAGQTRFYEYDTYGNLLWVERYNYIGFEDLQDARNAAAYIPSYNLGTDVYTYGDSEWKDLLTAYNGHAITYDAIGNPLTYYNGADYTMTWRQGRRLSNVTTGGQTINYEYDSEGKRTGKQVGTAQTTYLYAGGRLVSIEGHTPDYRIDLLYDESGVYGCIYNDASHTQTKYLFVKNAQGDIIQIRDQSDAVVANYTYDAWGALLSVTDENGAAITASAHIALRNPIRYRGYLYDSETGFYYVSSRYYDPEIGRFLNADNNFSNYNLFMYYGNNPVNRIDPNGEHWYYLWIDDLIEAVDELMASVSNIVYGRAAYERSYYDPKGANDLWNSRPFQDTKPSQEMQIFTEFMYDHDFVADISVSVDTPIKNTYVKVGASEVLSPNKNIDASYVHAGIGASTPSVLPINISYSVGIVKGVNAKENYAKHFLDIGAGAIYGFDYCWWPNGASAYSFTIGTSYGVYGGYDYYWCLD